MYHQWFIIVTVGNNLNVQQLGIGPYQLWNNLTMETLKEQ